MFFGRLARNPAICQAVMRRFAHQGPGHVHKVHETNSELWRKVSLYVAFPCIILAAINTYLIEMEEHHKPRPPFKPYEYMYRRTKRYPWGDGVRSFFHNPQTNALPDGYETEDPNAEGGHH